MTYLREYRRSVDLALAASSAAIEVGSVVGGDRGRLGAVGVGLLGYGYWGRNIARNIAASAEGELVAVAEPDDRTRGLLGADSGVPYIEKDAREVLSNDEVAAVVIATPVRTHFQLAKDALLSGKHVLVEKPLALSTSEANELVGISGEQNRVLMVGHTFLYSPPVAMLRSLICDGALGEVHYLYSQRLNLGRIRSDCDAIWNFAPHDVSIMLYVLSEAPVEVSARGFSFLQAGISDVGFASLAFASGRAAHLHVSWIDPRKVRSMTVVGSRRMVVYDDVSVDHKIAVYDSVVEKGDVHRTSHSFETLAEHQWKTRAGDVYLPRVDMKEPLLNEVNAFITACQTGEPPLTDGAHGRAVVAVLEAISQSAQKGGQTVKVAEAT